MQVGNFISYGVCKFICLSSFMYNRFHKELRFFFSLLKRKKKQKKKRTRLPLYCAAMHHTKIIQEIFTNKTPPAGQTGGLSAVTLPFLQLKLGRKVSGGLLSLSKSAVAISAGRRADPPQKALHRFSRAGLSCFLPAYASEFFCEGTAYKLVSHAGIYSWCRIYKS